MKIALVADPHVSLLEHTHCGMALGDNTAVTRAVIADINRHRPDMVIWMGDLTHEGTAEVRRCFADLHTRLEVPSVAFLGNHDVEHIDKAGFARETIPCARRMWWHMAGWNVVLLDTVRELSPDDPSGILSASESRFLRDVADESSGPMLVMGHHPLRPRYFDTQAFFNAASSCHSTGVYLGAHSHNDHYERSGAWHVFDIASCCHRPFGYRLMELSSRRLSITPVTVQVSGLERMPDDAVRPDPVFPVTVEVTAGQPKAAKV